MSYTSLNYVNIFYEIKSIIIINWQILSQARCSDTNCNFPGYFLIKNYNN